MLSAALLSAALALSAHAYDNYWTEYDVAVPNKVDGRVYEERDTYQGKDTQWRSLDDDVAGFSLGGDYSPDSVGYRIKDDDSSTVIFKYDGDVAPLEVTLGEGGTYGASVQWIHSLSVEYPDSKEAGSSQTKREFWDEAEFEELAFTSPSLSIVNVMCDAVTVHFELTDGNGEVITKDQELYPDSISLPVPETFPVTGNATFSDGSSLVFVLSGKDRILVSKADNGPKVSAGYDLQIQFCPD